MTQQKTSHPGISELLISCNKLAETRAFFDTHLGLSPTQGDSESAGSVYKAVDDLRLPVARRDYLRAPGDESVAGVGLQLVEFVHPGAPVRQAAGPFDSCAKTINFLCRDLPSVYKRLEKAGLEFRSPWVEYEKAGVRYRDVHLHGPDAMNIGLLEIVDEDYPVNSASIGPVAAVCFTLPELESVHALCGALALPQVLDEIFDGPAMETMLGLPPGGSLCMRLYGAEAARARFEFVSYNGVDAPNLHGQTRAPATGLMLASLRVENLPDTWRRLQQLEQPVYLEHEGGTSEDGDTQIDGELWSASADRAKRTITVRLDNGFRLQLAEFNGQSAGA